MSVEISRVCFGFLLNIDWLKSLSPFCHPNRGLPKNGRDALHASRPLHSFALSLDLIIGVFCVNSD